MGGGAQDFGDMAMDILRAHADTRYELPGAGVLDHELGLPGLFVVAPVARLHRVPVDFVQVRQVAAIFAVGGAGVEDGKCPAAVVLLGPRDGVEHVGFEMDDRLLAAPVLQIGMVGAMDGVEHDRAGGKIEGHTVAHAQIGVAAYGQVAAALGVATHGDGGAGQSALHGYLMAPEMAVGDDRWQAIDVDNVVDFGRDGRWHGF